MKGKFIRRMLQEMGLALRSGANNLESDYYVSSQGVPCVRVFVNGTQYQFTYFGTGGFFRIFSKGVKVVDIKDRLDVIHYFSSLKKAVQK